MYMKLKKVYRVQVEEYLKRQDMMQCMIKHNLMTDYSIIEMVNLYKYMFMSHFIGLCIKKIESFTAQIGKTILADVVQEIDCIVMGKNCKVFLFYA